VFSLSMKTIGRCSVAPADIAAERNRRRRERRRLLSPKKPRRTDGLKECTLCHSTKPVSEYYGRQKGSRDRLANWCKMCCRSRASAYKERMREAKNSLTTLSP
jgi:hypothetical protein